MQRLIPTGDVRVARLYTSVIALCWMGQRPLIAGIAFLRQGREGPIVNLVQFRDV